MLRRFRKVLIAVLAAAILLLGSAPAFAGEGRDKRSFPSDPGEPTRLAFPSDPGEPTP